MFKINAGHIEAFKEQITKLGRSAADTVIVIANIEDPFGKVVAQKLMSEREFHRYLDVGTDLFVRKLAVRKDMEEFLRILDEGVADKLKGTTGIPVVIISYGEVETFSA